MNSGNQNDGILYQAAAFAIFVVIVTLIVLATISSRSSDEIPTPADASATSKPTVTTPDQETTKKAPDTMAPAVKAREASIAPAILMNARPIVATVVSELPIAVPMMAVVTKTMV